MSDQNPLRTQFQQEFRAKPDTGIVQDLNREALCKGWTSARASYLWALREEMIARNWDFSTISPDENRLYLRYEVNLVGNKIEIIRDINKNA